MSRLLPGVLLAAACAPAAPAQGTPLPADRAAGAAAIDTERLRAWLTALTSEEMAGRATGTEGFARAAELVRDHFREIGLEPLVDGGEFFQEVPWVRSTVSEGGGLTVREGGEVVATLRPGDALGGFAGGGFEAEGDLVLAVLGGEDELDEAMASAVRDRVVLVRGAEPGGMRAWFGVARALRDAGAAAVLPVDDGTVARFGGVLGRSGPGRGAGNRAMRARGRMPGMLFVTEAAADELVAAAGVEPAEGAGVTPLTPLRASLELRVEERQAPAWNVVGLLRGSDPDLADEYVVVGSHLDHLGARGETRFPGADDDGSGTAAVMAVASAFAGNPQPPRRSVVFVTFCGEERGLVGSRWFTENPPIPLSAIVAELQMDMVGRNEESGGEKAEENTNSLHLIGTEKLSAELHEVCVQRNREHAGFELEWDEEDVFYRSDHWSFARQGVPVAFFFTGFHPQYHEPTDTVDRIDFDKLARVARYVYDIAFELATRERRPHVDPARWEALRRKAAPKPAAPLTDAEAGR